MVSSLVTAMISACGARGNGNRTEPDAGPRQVLDGLSGSLPGQAYAYLVRSPHAHASIVSIDVSGAIGCRDVLAVLTGSDAACDGLRPTPEVFLSPKSTFRRI
jgi:Aldehyde oxidase and xanthine dehydrogenase, a/b hammerhead domain